MKLILHIGMEKTGSTALQRTLLTMRKDLRERAILYPKLPISGLNHNFLRLLTGNKSDIPRLYWHKIEQDPDFFVNVVGPSWDALRRSIDECKPQTLILSGEILFGASRHDTNAELKRKLFSLSDDIVTVAYVRRPSDHYVSSIQEVLKHSGTFSPPRAPAIRSHIEDWAKHLEREVRVLGYERSLLLNGDITYDFLHRVLDDQDWKDVNIPRVTANASHSIEGMSLLQDFRRTVLPGRDNERVDSSVSWREAISSAENSGLALTRPSLNPSLAAEIDHSCSDLLWLKDCHGIVFPGIDYSKVTGTPPTWRGGSAPSLSEICEVNEGRKSALYSHAVNFWLEKHLALREQRRSRKKRSLISRLLS